MKNITSQICHALLPSESAVCRKFRQLPGVELVSYSKQLVKASRLLDPNSKNNLTMTKQFCRAKFNEINFK